VTQKNNSEKPNRRCCEDPTDRGLLCGEVSRKCWCVRGIEGPKKRERGGTLSVGAARKDIQDKRGSCAHPRGISLRLMKLGSGYKRGPRESRRGEADDRGIVGRVLVSTLRKRGGGEQLNLLRPGKKTGAGEQSRDEIWHTERLGGWKRTGGFARGHAQCTQPNQCPRERS